MAIDQIVSLLIQERDKLNRAIEALQGTKRRGRPPRNGTEETRSGWGSAGGKRGRKFSKAQRAAAAKRMKAYWAAKKKTEN